MINFSLPRLGGSTLQSSANWSRYRRLRWTWRWRELISSSRIGNICRNSGFGNVETTSGNIYFSDSFMTSLLNFLLVDDLTSRNSTRLWSCTSISYAGLSFVSHILNYELMVHMTKPTTILFSLFLYLGHDTKFIFLSVSVLLENISVLWRRYHWWSTAANFRSKTISQGGIMISIYFLSFDL